MTAAPWEKPPSTLFVSGQLAAVFRRYDLSITNDRDLVTSVARNLLARMI